jgi:O-antigen/teichoic acid export membrane protein
MTICKIAVQILVVKYAAQSFYLYLLLEIIFACFITVFLRARIRGIYPWLQANAAIGKRIRGKYPVIMTKTKQLFSHSIAGFVLIQTDQLLIFSFTSLTMVTIFSNYNLIIQKLVYVIDLVLGSTTAGIGNLIATNDNFRIKKVFGELMALRYWIAGTVVFCLYHLTPSFVTLWLGESFILDKWAFYLMLVNVYILITRQTIQSYLIGYGLFKDVWAPWVEAILNITISIWLAYYYGVVGILLGSALSLILIVVLWKPYFLYTEGFKEQLINYWKIVGSYIILFSICSLLVTIIYRNLTDTGGDPSFFHWAVKAACLAVSFSFIYGVGMYLTSASMRNLKVRLMSIIPKSRFHNI